MMDSKQAIACPICKNAVALNPRPKTFPFCSSRCKAVDLGRWFDGNYALDPESGKLDIIDPEQAEELDEDDLGYH